VQEMDHIKMVHSANFGEKQLSALELVNSLAEEEEEASKAPPVQPPIPHPLLPMPQKQCIYCVFTEIR
jgi:hypothetical protein